MPVIITCIENLKPILPEGLVVFFNSGNTGFLSDYWKKRIRAVPCSTVSGRKLVYALKCEQIYIHGRSIGEYLIAVINKKLTETDEYDALIPVSIMNIGGSNNDEITEKNIYSNMQADNR